MKRIKPRDSRNIFYKNGTWWVLIQINGKRYRQKAGETEAQARAFRDKLKTYKRDQNAGLPCHMPEGQPIRFEKFADDYLKLYAKHKRSYSRDELSVDHLKAFFKGRLLKDINAMTVARYRAERAKATVVRINDAGKRCKVLLSIRTINRELACLRTILRKAVEWEKLPAYPLSKEKLLSREPEFKPRILEPEESRALIAVADKKWLRPAIIVWLNTGLRKRELLRLHRTDVDFKKRTLTVTADHAKNGHERTIPINDLVAETLAPMPGETYFFEHPETGNPVLQIDGAWRTAKTRAGIKGRLRIHDCRDTYATLLLRGDPERAIPGVDIRTVAELIGDDPATALKRYCHSNERVMRQAADRTAELVLGSGPKVDAADGGEPVTSSPTVN